MMVSFTYRIDDQEIHSLVLSLLLHSKHKGLKITLME